MIAQTRDLGCVKFSAGYKIEPYLYSGSMMGRLCAWNSVHSLSPRGLIKSPGNDEILFTICRNIYLGPLIAENPNHHLSEPQNCGARRFKVVHCNCVLLDKLAVGRTIDYLSKILVGPSCSS